MLSFKHALASSAVLGATSAREWMFPEEITMPYVDDSADLSDGKRTFAEICAENGFAYEEHSVTTSDGYILTVFRIPGKTNEKYSSKPPVMFQHGVFDSAYGWIMNYADIAPGFVAASQGYDVWLGNSRGNTYSKKHVSLNPNHAKYWEFDWQEMSLDVDAVTDHIINVTGYEKVAYVGHSQGTTQMYYALSENQDYWDKKISVFVALGPVTKIPYNQSTLIHMMGDFYDEVDDAVKLFNVNELMGQNWLTSEACHLFCTFIPWLCKELEKWFINSDPQADNQDRFTIYMDHEPNGSPTRSLLHYAQTMREDRFQVWAPDYHQTLGRDKRITDLIPLEKITKTPVAMFVGKADILADAVDAEWARETIGDAVFHYQLIEGGHLTFMVGKDMSYFTKDVMGILKKYQPLSSSDIFLQ